MTASTFPSPVEASSKPRHSAAVKRPGGFRRMLPLLLVLAGVLVFLYPVVATRYNNVIEEKRSHGYSTSVAELPPDKRIELLERAHEYNRNGLNGPVLDPWLARISDTNEQYKDYQSQLRMSDNEVMARIVIPSIRVNLPIYHGTDENTLKKGVGHLFGSSLPVGGEGTHSVLTGHTGLGNATLFDHLDQLHKDKAFYIEVMGQRMKYQVDQVKVVLPEQTDDLQPIVGQDLITLITCTPYGINTHRLLVRGHRVPIEPHENVDEIFDETDNSPWSWWMIAIVVGVAIILLFLLLKLLLALLRRRKRKKNESETSEDDLLAALMNDHGSFSPRLKRLPSDRVRHGYLKPPPYAPRLNTIRKNIDHE